MKNLKSINRDFLLILSLITVLNSYSKAQVDYTANEKIPTYQASFITGMNLGYYGSNWSDQQISDILLGNKDENISGIGCNSLRLSLPESFVDKWGYDIRVNAFNHYGSLGAINNTVFIGYPSDDNFDTTKYCFDEKSKMFANMYESIWDNGENGTPINDNNFMALYVYKLAKTYTNNVTYWEIWNEPDFSVNGSGGKQPEEEGNWWDQDPNPCDLKNLKAPIQHYIRALRIAYEVIKSIDENDYICVGGIGYKSFLDAVLRNTDNPNDGKETIEFPLKGGAYFDCLSYHKYPMYYLRNWENGEFLYFRHSDKAVQKIINTKIEFEELLISHSYDGIHFPNKRFIITETNIPSKSFNNFIGSPEAQRNFVMKTIVKAPMANIDAVHFFLTADSKPKSEATNSYQLMGFYNNISDEKPYEQRMKMSGIGSLTSSIFLENKKYSLSKTIDLKLPYNIDGGAFKGSEGKYIYALWAKTTEDNSEDIEVEYSFPSTFDFSTIHQHNWDYAKTNSTKTYYSNKISLFGYPTFIELDETIVTSANKNFEQKNIIEVFPNPTNGDLTFRLSPSLTSIDKVEIIDANGENRKELFLNNLTKVARSTYTFSLSFPPSLYIINFYTKHMVISKKIVKH